jgi:hypothetical protein
MPQDVEIPISRANLEESVVRAIPLVHNLLDHVLMVVEIEADGALVRFPARVANHTHGHLLSL